MKGARPPIRGRDAGLGARAPTLPSASATPPRAWWRRSRVTPATKLIDEVLGGFDEPPPKRDLDPLAVYLISGLEGLALERLERGETRELGRAREIFVSAAAVAIRST